VNGYVISAYQVIIDMLIWVFAVLVPILLPPTLIVWGSWKCMNRKKHSIGRKCSWKAEENSSAFLFLVPASYLRLIFGKNICPGITFLQVARLVKVNRYEPEGIIKILEEDMKKSTLFVSAALTAFVLVILAGVVMAFNNNTTQTSAVAPATAVVEVLPTAIPETATAAPTDAPPAAPVSPQDAAGIAAQFMNKQDVYSVESFTLDSANVYKVTFSSGDIVYVGLDGKVISTAKLQPVVVTNIDPTPKPHKKNNNNGGGNNSGGGGEHESEHD
jgi:hypothetical protein